MSKIDCEACAELLEIAPCIQTSGITDDMCESLANDTGLNPDVSPAHDDCEDLNIMNDCLVGQMEKKIESYDVCDWKKYAHGIVSNIYEMIKGIICTICGIWDNIHNLWTKVNSHDCAINSMNSGVTFTIGENTEGDAYAVAGKGVSFLKADGQTITAHDIYLAYVAGGFVRGGGSYIFHNSDFTDLKACGNFDNGSDYRVSQERKGNSVWGQTGRPAGGGELICEFRIKRSAYPQIKELWGGFGQESGGGAYHVQATVTNAGHYASGQHGGCYPETGEPTASGYDRGHLVPSGWIYVQLRLTYAFEMSGNATQYTPHFIMGMRPNLSGFDC